MSEIPGAPRGPVPMTPGIRVLRGLGEHPGFSENFTAGSHPDGLQKGTFVQRSAPDVFARA